MNEHADAIISSNVGGKIDYTCRFVMKINDFHIEDQFMHMHSSKDHKCTQTDDFGHTWFFSRLSKMEIIDKKLVQWRSNSSTKINIESKRNAEIKQSYMLYHSSIDQKEQEWFSSAVRTMNIGQWSTEWKYKFPYSIAVNWVEKMSLNWHNSLFHRREKSSMQIRNKQFELHDRSDWTRNPR